MIEPKLRFKADDGSEFPEWEEKKLGDVADVKVGEKPTFVSDNAAYEYVNAGTTNSGYVDSYNCDGDTVTTPSRGQGGIGYVGYQKHEFWLGPLCYKIKSNKDDVLTKFMYYALSFDSKKIVDLKKVGTIPAINRADLIELYMKFPCLAEQQKIAEFLSTIDTVIEKQKETVSAWEERKKGVMQKLFSQEVRFKADDGSDFPEWEEKKIANLYRKNVEKNVNLEFDSSKTISIASMQFNEKGNGASEDSLSSYKVLRLGDIAFEGHENKEYSHGRFVLNDIGDGIMSPRFSCMRPVCTQVDGFWKYYIHSERVMRNILVRSTKKGTMMHELVIPDFLKQSIMVPSLPEQQKIADCLSSLDEVIEKQKATLAAWEELKKGLLQQMFV